MGDILDETDEGHVRVGFEDLLLAADDACGGLVDVEPGDDTRGRVVGGLADIISTVRELGCTDLKTPVLKVVISPINLYRVKHS